MSEKENINPKINKTSGYMSEESYSYSKRDESPFKRSKQEQISSSSSSSKNSTPTPENQPAQEPNSERLQNFYNKMLKFSSLKNISEDDLYDKVEECFMYCKKLIKNADKNIYYNEADYKLVSEIMNLVAITTIRAKFLDNLKEYLLEVQSAKMPTATASNSGKAKSKFPEPDFLPQFAIDIKSIFKVSGKNFQEQLRGKLRTDYNNKNHQLRSSQGDRDYKQALKNNKEITDVSVVQSYLDLGQTEVAKKYIISDLLNDKDSNLLGGKLLFSIKHENIGGFDVHKLENSDTPSTSDPDDNHKNNNNNNHNNKNRPDSPTEIENKRQFPQLSPLIEKVSRRYNLWIDVTRIKIRQTIENNRRIESAVLAKMKEEMDQQGSKQNSNEQYIKINKKNYLKMKLLGRGGFSKVYKVFDQEKGNEYALKVIDCEGAPKEITSSFENEIDALQILSDNDNIIKLIDFEITVDKRYVVLECGETDLLNFIRSRMAQERKRNSQKQLAESIKTLLPLSELRVLFRHMVRAVNVMHQNGMIHLDLKPANFILAKGIVKLIDFGISNKLPTTETTSLNMKGSSGTPNYMAPEQLSRQKIAGVRSYRVGKKADVWSLGCILHYMSFSKTPYQHIEDNDKKFAHLCNFKMAVPIKTSKYEVLNKILKERILVKNVELRATTQELLLDDFFNDDYTNMTGLSGSDNISVLSTENHKSVSMMENSQLLDMNALTPGTSKAIKSLLQRKTEVNKSSSKR